VGLPEGKQLTLQRLECGISIPTAESDDAILPGFLNQTNLRLGTGTGRDVRPRFLADLFSPRLKFMETFPTVPNRRIGENKSGKKGVSTPIGALCLKTGMARGEGLRWHGGIWNFEKFDSSFPDGRDETGMCGGDRPLAQELFMVRDALLSSAFRQKRENPLDVVE
jgi:hypothetical protein